MAIVVWSNILGPPHRSRIDFATRAIILYIISVPQQLVYIAIMFYKVSVGGI